MCTVKIPKRIVTEKEIEQLRFPFPIKIENKLKNFFYFKNLTENKLIYVFHINHMSNHNR